jgi:hypothetical protein
MQASRNKGIYHESEQAEALAVAALGFLAADADRLGRFLALSGIAPQAIRAAAREPHFLVGVLDHVLADEAGLLLPFAAAEGIRPEDVATARTTLAGRPGHTGA